MLNFSSDGENELSQDILDIQMQQRRVPRKARFFSQEELGVVKARETARATSVREKVVGLEEKQFKAGRTARIVRDTSAIGGLLKLLLIGIVGVFLFVGGFAAVGSIVSFIKDNLIISAGGLFVAIFIISRIR